MTDVSAFSVLVVDDDDVAAEAVVRGLHKHGMRCPIVIAEDGHAALQSFGARMPRGASRNRTSFCWI